MHNGRTQKRLGTPLHESTHVCTLSLSVLFAYLFAPTRPMELSQFVHALLPRPHARTQGLDQSIHGSAAANNLLLLHLMPPSLGASLLSVGGVWFGEVLECRMDAKGTGLQNKGRVRSFD